jgi:hypothetical protein
MDMGFTHAYCESYQVIKPLIRESLYPWYRNQSGI